MLANILTLNWFDGMAGVIVTGLSVVAFEKFKGRWIEWRRSRLFVGGVEAVDGLIEKVEPAPIRLKKLEGVVSETRNTVNRLMDAHLDLTSQVSAMSTRVETIDDNMKRLFENGNNSTDTGDLVAMMAKKMGVYPESGRPQRRRNSDPPPPKSPVTS